MNESNYDIELLGQKIKYPASWQSVAGAALTLTVISITILGGAYLLSKAPADNIRALSSIFIQNVNKDGKTSSVSGFRLEFWTPSVKTKDYFDELEKIVSYDYQWQVSEDIYQRVNDFGTHLTKDSSISGYRRYEVVGEGESGHKKWGWWWVIGIQGAYSNDYRDWFVKTYREYWGLSSDETVYVEILSTPDN